MTFRSETYALVKANNVIGVRACTRRQVPGVLDATRSGTSMRSRAR